MALLQAYVAAGFDPSAFWRLTPRLYFSHMRGARARDRRRFDEGRWMAWHTAALHRAEKMPKLDDFMAPSKERRDIAFDLRRMASKLPVISMAEYRARHTTGAQAS